MISFSNMDPDRSDALDRSGMLAAGVTQAGVTASTEASRKAGSDAIAASLDGTTLGKNPRSTLNPLSVGPTSARAFVQPGTGNPATPGVSVQVEGRLNPLGIQAAQTPYTQPGTSNPPAPLPGQFSAVLVGSIGVSKITRADGTIAST